MRHAVVVVLTLFVATVAAAQPTTYTYTGDPYTVATAPYAVGGQLTGSFTVANPLPPFLSDANLVPSLIAMSFNDGVETRTLSNSFICQLHCVHRRRRQYHAVGDPPAPFSLQSRRSAPFDPFDRLSGSLPGLRSVRDGYRAGVAL